MDKEKRQGGLKDDSKGMFGNRNKLHAVVLSVLGIILLIA
jgi:hypothetical protein